MAIGKVRPSKRSSGTSYSSTLTTIIVVGLCVYGVWMLSSNNVFSPGTTARTATATSTQSSSSMFSDSHQSHAMKPIAKKSQPVFDDSQGDLPEDAIKPDHETIHDAHKDESSDLHNDSAVGDTSGDSEQETNGASESSTDNSNEAEENKDTGVNEEERNAHDKDLAVEENPQGLTGHESEEEKEKQKQAETQNSEESSLTQNQEAEKIVEEHTMVTAQTDVAGQEERKQPRHDQDIGTQPEKKSSNNEHPENQEISGDKEHEISDADQQQRLQQHQQQEDEQIQQGKPQEAEGATSHNQIEQNEKPIKDGNKIDQTSVNGSKNIINEAAAKKDEPSVPGGESSAIPQESKDSKRTWSTQADESDNQKERRKVGTDDQDGSSYGYKWQLCNTTAGTDYIPCLDNEKAIAKLQSRRHYEHRERHCPEDAPTCLVPLPKGYKKSIAWPQSRDKV